MRAVLVHELGSLDNGSLAEAPDPSPGPGQLLIEVHAVPVNYVDVVIMSGKYQFKPQMPYTPGKGPAGIVRAVGAGVTGFRPGDRVLGMWESGGWAELAAIDAVHCHPIPDAMSFVDAASISLAFDTSWMALRERARIAPGETVLVLGANGAVGLAGVQLAKAMGARVVMGAVSTPAKYPPVAEAGADAMIDLSRPDLKESLREQVYAATGGHGADIILDPLGGDIFEAAIRAIAWRGRVVILGFAAGAIPSLKINYVMLKNMEISGLQISDYRRRKPEMIRACYEEIFAFWTAGRIKAPPSVTMPLADFAKGLHMIAERKATKRIVLLPRRQE